MLISFSPLTSPLYTSCAVTFPSFPLDLNTPSLEIVPKEESESCHTASAGISAIVPTRSVPIASNFTSEPGV